MRREVAEALKKRGIKPSAQRMAVARFVLRTDEHPSAEKVLSAARKTLPILSRATVYNTLHLFVRKGLLRELSLAPGRVVFDANMDRHHHFIDDATGRIRDVPWGALKVSRVASVEGYHVRDYQVVLRGRVSRD